MNSNIMKSFVSVIIIAVSGLATIPVLTRNLSPEDLGHVSLLLIFFTLTSAFDGIRPVIVYNYSRYKDSVEYFIFTVDRLAWTIGFVSGLIIASLLFVAFGEQLSGVEIVLLSLSTVVYFPMTGRWAMLDAREKVGFTALSRSFVWMLVYGSFIVFSITEMPFWLYSFSLLGMNCLLYLVFMQYKKEGKKRDGRFDKELMKELLSKAKHYLFFQMSAYAISFLDRMFLARLQPIATLGYYTPQYELGTRCTIFVRILNSVLYPRFSRLVNEGHKELVKEQWQHITKLMLTFFSFLTWTVLAMSGVIIRIFAGSDYEPHSPVLQIIMLGVLVNLSGSSAALLLNSFGKFKEQGRVYILGVIIGLGLAYPMIKAWGIYGAALTYLGMHSVDFLLFLWAYKIVFKYVPLKCILLAFLLAAIFVIELQVSVIFSGVLLFLLFLYLLNWDDLKFVKYLAVNKL